MSLVVKVLTGGLETKTKNSKARGLNAVIILSYFLDPRFFFHITETVPGRQGVTNFLHDYLMQFVLFARELSSFRAPLLQAQ